ncbi:hypothetical protein AAMO2058_001212500 [Amorphochlora amoebiformis]|uniref:protein-serine/threonine phosphatase n=1 Tax=Amorphochlora amoebiformis TaxID=1561963 RepID=A0A7S0D4N2_9EUKA|mmetsp:Transcript_18998/g.30211  ORF Transcript_18998/g.30211 Transcript_18998/m.30211 type:complete len:494 (+) Transcript_18998:131-1612(+)
MQANSSESPAGGDNGRTPEIKMGSRANEYKIEGNKLFREHKYEGAIDMYSKAIELDEKNAVYWANRAFCHVHMENFGLAIADAKKGIQVDPSYPKSYYRMGSAHAGLGHFKLAMQDFKRVLAIRKTDTQAKKRFKECQKAWREQQFFKAIQSENSKPVSETIKIDDIDVPKDYTGPHLPASGPDKKFLEELTKHLTDQKDLHRKYAYEILLKIIELFKSLPSLVDVPIPEGKKLTVCGDVHGQYYDVLNIFKLNGWPSEENPYLFNGDFVDRGSFAIQVILTFFTLKLMYPKHFHMTRGNHETITMNRIYGFEGEVLHKYDQKCFQLFTEAFNLLPLACVVENQALVVHGGLFTKDGVTLNDIRKINRNRQPPESGLMCEVMWSDPQPFPGRAPSKRGVGLSFGPDVTKKFLEENKLKMLIRSHEVKQEGYEVMHEGQCITVFSAPNYFDQMGNKAAFITLTHDMVPKFTQYEAVPHPNVRPMAFARRGFGMM